MADGIKLNKDMLLANGVEPTPERAAAVNAIGVLVAQQLYDMGRSVVYLDSDDNVIISKGIAEARVKAATIMLNAGLSKTEIKDILSLL